MWFFLLILGQVPGTDIRITFWDLLVILILSIILWRNRKTLLHPSYILHLIKIHLRTRKGQQLRLQV